MAPASGWEHGVTLGDLLGGSRKQFVVIKECFSQCAVLPVWEAFLVDYLECLGCSGIANKHLASAQILSCSSFPLRSDFLPKLTL